MTTQFLSLDIALSVSSNVRVRNAALPETSWQVQDSFKGSEPRRFLVVIYLTRLAGRIRGARHTGGAVVAGLAAGDRVRPTARLIPCSRLGSARFGHEMSSALLGPDLEALESQVR